jgi:hypothetical protein
MLEAKIFERQIILKPLGAINPKGINRIVKISLGHLCLREENISNDNSDGLNL